MGFVFSAVPRIFIGERKKRMGIRRVSGMTQLSSEQIEAILKKIRKNHFILITPALFLLCILFMLLYIIFYPYWVITIIPVYVLVARSFHFCVFASDRDLSLILGYQETQTFLHGRLFLDPPDNRFHRVISKYFLTYFAPPPMHPFFSCRIKVLQKWHKKEIRRNDV